jgi:hypothetical protein
MHRWIWTSFHDFYKGRKQNGDRRENAPELEEQLNTEIQKWLSKICAKIEEVEFERSSEL